MNDPRPELDESQSVPEPGPTADTAESDVELAEDQTPAADLNKEDDDDA